MFDERYVSPSSLTISASLAFRGNQSVLRVSVIIPTLNEEQNVAAAIVSASNSGADEVIVVDGGSSDETVSIASRTATIHEIASPGRAAQQNAGAGLATGDVLLFLHADCRLDASAVQNLRKRLENSPEIIGGCFHQQIDESGMVFRMVEAGNLFRVRVLKWAYGDQAIFVRTAPFRQLGGFPRVKLMEDLLLMKTLKKHGHVVVINSTVVVSARRWRYRGVARQTLRNWCLILALHAGVSPDWLKSFYPNDR